MMRTVNRVCTSGPLASLIPLAILAASFTAGANTHTWTGAGANSYWSTSANWAGGAPAAGEAAPVVLVFPSGAPRLNNTNNLSSLTVHGMSFTGSGYSIQGSGGGTTITFTSSSGAEYAVAGANNTLGSSLSITLVGTPRFNIASAGALHVLSALTGSGGFFKEGRGSLSLESLAGNSYTGTTTVADGDLVLSGGYPFFGGWLPAVTVPGPLVIGGTNMLSDASVLLVYDAQFADSTPVTINPNGYLYLGGNNQTIGNLTMTGGSLYGNSLETSAIGTLTLGGNVTAPYTSLINGFISANLNLGGASRTFDVGGLFAIYGSISDAAVAPRTVGITKTGAGTLYLNASTNTYTGQTTVSQGILRISGPAGLGITNAGTVVSAGATLELNDVNLVAEPVTLNGGSTTPALWVDGACKLSGQITLAGVPIIHLPTTNDFLQVAAVFTGNGGYRKTGAGTLCFTGASANTYAGDTFIDQGTLQLGCGYWSGVPYLIWHPALAVPGPLHVGPWTNPVTVTILASGQLSPSAPITLESSALLDLNGNNTSCGPLSFLGGLILSSHSSATLTLNGDISAPVGGHGDILTPVSLGGANRRVIADTNSNIAFWDTVSNGGSPAGWIKDGPGIMELRSSSTYSGSTVVSNGLLSVFNPAALGTGPVVVYANGCLQLIGGSQANPVFNNPLTLNGNGLSNGGALNGVGTNTWAGPIGLASDSSITTSYTNDLLVLSGAISGGGGLGVAGRGTISLAGADNNTFAGDLWTRGTNRLWLNKTSGVAVPHALYVGDGHGGLSSSVVTLRQDNQIDDRASVVVSRSGQFNVGAQTDTVGGLTFFGGEIVGTGTLTLGGDVASYASGLGLTYAYVYCNLSLGGRTRTFTSADAALVLFGTVSDGASSAGLTKAGNELLTLAGSNTYSGTTWVTQGTLRPANEHALGSTAGGTVLTGGAGLELTGVSIQAEPLVVKPGTNEVLAWITWWSGNTWSGPITLNDSLSCAGSGNTAWLTLSGPITGPGGLVTSGRSLVTLCGSSPNTYTGETIVGEGTLLLSKTNTIAVAGPLAIGDSGSPSNCVVRLVLPDQIADSVPVGLWPSGLLDLQGYNEAIGDLNGTGLISLGSAVLTTGGTNLVNTYGGVLAGSLGGLGKVGSNTLVLTGNNLYTGATRVREGTLLVNGAQPDSAVFVEAGANLGGSGRVGRTFSYGGTISPGASPGRLTIDGSAQLDAASTVVVELAGTNAGQSYDQLDLLGQLAANNARLRVVMAFSGAVSNQYTIVRHLAGLTSTVFAGLLEGGAVTADNGAQFAITYGGGAGHDIVLTQLTLAAGPQLTRAEMLPGGIARLSASGSPGVTYSVLANDDLGTSHWILLGSVTADDAGQITFTDMQSTNCPQRFYRLVWP